MENQSTNQNWDKLVLEQETSGLTQNEYCKQKGIKIDAFKYHRSKHSSIKKSNSERSFLELQSTGKRDNFADNSKDTLAFRIDFRIKDWFNLEIRLG